MSPWLSVVWLESQLTSVSAGGLWCKQQCNRPPCSILAPPHVFSSLLLVAMSQWWCRFFFHIINTVGNRRRFSRRLRCCGRCSPLALAFHTVYNLLLVAVNSLKRERCSSRRTIGFRPHSAASQCAGTWSANMMSTSNLSSASVDIVTHSTKNLNVQRGVWLLFYCVFCVSLLLRVVFFPTLYAPSADGPCPGLLKTLAVWEINPSLNWMSVFVRDCCFFLLSGGLE